AVGKREVSAEVVSASTVDNESPLRIVLLQGIARGEKMDLILQKATELGVAAIVPVNGERTEVRLDAERAQKRLAHWRSVVGSACGQSGRARVPEVHAPAALDAAAAALPGNALRLLLDPQGEHRLASLQLQDTDTVVVAIGPEGGWSPRDREVLHAAGFRGLRLGPRVLRAETAGLAAIAALQARFGDLWPGHGKTPARGRFHACPACAGPGRRQGQAIAPRASTTSCSMPSRSGSSAPCSPSSTRICTPRGSSSSDASASRLSRGTETSCGNEAVCSARYGSPSSPPSALSTTTRMRPCGSSPSP